jgi:hypothetical protein
MAKKKEWHQKKAKTAAKKAVKKTSTKTIAKTAAKKKAPVKKTPALKKSSTALAPAEVTCVSADRAQAVMDGCMTTFGVGGLSKATQMSAALPSRVNAFCSCIRTNSGVSAASCSGSMTFQQVEVGLVCP